MFHNLLYLIREKAIYDWPPARFCLGRVLFFAFRLAILVRRGPLAFKLGSALLSSTLFPAADRAVIRAFRTGATTWVRKSLDSFLEGDSIDQKFDKDPGRLVGARLLVCKSWSPGERGVIVLDYNYAFPIFVRNFDLGRIAERYRLYVEPSWTGLVCQEVLCLTKYPDTVYCGAFEPRDHEVLSKLQTNLHPIADLGTGAFVDDTFFSPCPSVPVKYDLITIARWARYKRYGALFRCLADLRRKRGPQLRVACVGYPGDLSLDDIRQLAHHHGVHESIDLFEVVPRTKVRDLLRASRVNVLWSRREGTGRTPFEGLLTDVPLILREGFNYGYRYAYIRDGVGHFADESSFVEVATRLLDQDHQVSPRHYQVSPRQWMLHHLAATVSTRRLEEVMKAEAEAAGETWTRDLVVRFSGLDAQDYQDQAARQAFDHDHAFLRDCLLNHHNVAEGPHCNGV